MFKISTYMFVICIFLLASCKEEIKKNEVETRKEISSELEKAGLQKQSHHDDEVIAAMNVVYKTKYSSLSSENKKILSDWASKIDYASPKQLYDDMFASFNMSEQVASLIDEYSDKEYANVNDRDVYNQTVSLLFLKDNDPEQLGKTIKLFSQINKLSNQELANNNIVIDTKTWNKGMSKNFAEYWAVHSTRVLEAADIAKSTTLSEFLNQKSM